MRHLLKRKGFIETESSEIVLVNPESCDLTLRSPELPKCKGYDSPVEPFASIRRGYNYIGDEPLFRIYLDLFEKEKKNLVPF